MENKPYPTITFYPGGQSRVRFELRLSERYVLAGDYVQGVLNGVTLFKQTAKTSAGKGKER